MQASSEECEEVTEKTKEIKEKTLKPTEEISSDKEDRVEKRSQESKSQIPKGKIKF